MKKILVIEDEADLRANVSRFLKAEGFEVLAAANGAAGVETALAQMPDLIVCDITMPEMDGFGVLQALRDGKETATIPFVFLSARGEKLDVRLGMNYGADDYLTKPVGHEELLAAIAARLERKRSFDDHAEEQLANLQFAPDFSSPSALEKLGLTPREAEVLLWVAQGKSNADIAIIAGASEKTVKNHLTHVFEKLGVEGRNAATVRAIEVLSTPVPKSKAPG